MIFQLKQQFQIESARFLPNLPTDHPCARVHGHSFVIVLTLHGPLDEKIGWVQDYHEINQIVTPVLNQLDHRLLNDVPGLENPTSELLAFWIYSRLIAILPKLRNVTVKETSLTECTYPVS